MQDIQKMHKVLGIKFQKIKYFKQPRNLNAN